MMQAPDPNRQRNQRRQKPAGLAPPPLAPQPQGEDQRNHYPGLLHQRQRHRGGHRELHPVLDEPQQRQRGEQHGRHIQLRQHRLRKEHRAGAHQRGGQKRRHAADLPRQLDGQQERRQGRARRRQQHGRPRHRQVETGHLPPPRQVRHHGGRMHGGRRRVRNPRPVQQVQRRRNVLPRLVPEVRQVQRPQVAQEKNPGEDSEENQVRDAPLRAPLGPGCGCGSTVRCHRGPAAPA